MQEQARAERVFGRADPDCGSRAKIVERRCLAFSAIELIGLLAVLVILATLILPRVWQPARIGTTIAAVNQAHIQQVVANLQALKTAVTEHRARFGSLASRNGTPFAVPASYDRYDTILLAEQLLDRPFAVNLGSGASVRLVNVSGLSTSSRVDSFGGAYDLDGRGANAISGAAFALETVISGVTEAEAKALNDALDGPALGAAPGEDDLRGRVIYRGGNPRTPRELHIYVTHQ
jgi:hypothetical protein